MSIDKRRGEPVRNIVLENVQPTFSLLRAHAESWVGCFTMAWHLTNLDWRWTFSMPTLDHPVGAKVFVLIVVSRDDNSLASVAEESAEARKVFRRAAESCQVMINTRRNFNTRVQTWRRFSDAGCGSNQCSRTCFFRSSVTTRMFRYFFDGWNRSRISYESTSVLEQR